MRPEMVRGSYRPYEIGRCVIQPEAKPYMFEITLQPETLQAIGILNALTSIIAREGVPILQLKVSTPAPNLPVRILLAVDLKGREELAEKLAYSFKKVQGVVSVEYAPSLFNGVGIDAWSHPLTFQGGRVAIIPQQLMAGMLNMGWKEFGTPFAALLYHSFFNGIVEVYNAFISKVATRREEQIKFAEELFRMLGWGIVKFEKFTDKEAIVRVYDNLECLMQKGAGDARGAVVRGMVAGFVSCLWGTGRDKIEVSEVMCIAKGDSYCEYVVKKL